LNSFQFKPGDRANESLTHSVWISDTGGAEFCPGWLAHCAFEQARAPDNLLQKSAYARE